MTCVKQSKETVTVLLMAKKIYFYIFLTHLTHSYFTHFHKFKIDNDTGLNEALAKDGKRITKGKPLHTETRMKTLIYHLIFKLLGLFCRNWS